MDDSSMQHGAHSNTTIPDALEMASGQQGAEWFPICSVPPLQHAASPIHHHSNAAASSSYQEYSYLPSQSHTHHSQHLQPLPPLQRFHPQQRHLEASHQQQFEQESEWRQYNMCDHHHHPSHAGVPGSSSQNISSTLVANTIDDGVYPAYDSGYGTNDSIAEDMDRTSTPSHPGQAPVELHNLHMQVCGHGESGHEGSSCIGGEGSGGGGVNHRLRPHSTPATLCWLERNYELSEGVCIPRNVVYFNYVDFCSKNQMQPVNAASFGKIIRQMFANLTTRRLGTRGQSRYHYYGLAVKPDSIYYSPNYSSRKMSNLAQDAKFSPKLRGDCTAQHPSGSYDGSGASASSSSSSSGGCAFATMQQLPEFPSFREFDQASNIPSDKLQTLILMYRAHCQRIMDSVNKFSFTEEIPPHIAGLLGQNIVVTLIGICDAILYRTILKAILPTALQMFPENVLKIIRKFADDIVGSLQFSLKHVPDNLIYVKMKLVKQLSKMLKRRTSVNHLYQAACLVINPGNEIVYQQMMQEWKKIELKKIIDDCGSKVCSSEEIKSILEKFKDIVERRSSIGQFCLWTSGVFDTFTKSLQPESVNFISKIRRFMVLWNSISTKLLKQIKIQKPSHASNSFHLLHLMLNEFILHEMERLVCEDSMKELMLNMVNSQATELSDSSFIDSLGQDFLSCPNLVLHQEESSLTNSRRKCQSNQAIMEQIQKKVKTEKLIGCEKQTQLSMLTKCETIAVVANPGYWTSSSVTHSPSEITYTDPLLTYAASTVDMPDNARQKS